MNDGPTKVEELLAKLRAEYPGLAPSPPFRPRRKVHKPHGSPVRPTVPQAVIGQIVREGSRFPALTEIQYQFTKVSPKLVSVKAPRWDPSATLTLCRLSGTRSVEPKKRREPLLRSQLTVQTRKEPLCQKNLQFLGQSTCATLPKAASSNLSRVSRSIERWNRRWFMDERTALDFSHQLVDRATFRYKPRD